MRVTVIDTYLRKHSFDDVACSTSVSHLKLLLANMSLVPDGYLPKLEYQRRILDEDDSLAGIGYSSDSFIYLACFRSVVESGAAQKGQPHASLASAQPENQNGIAYSSAPVTFNATPLEVTKAHFRDSFLHAQPPLTRAIKHILECKFGKSDWLSQYQSFLSPSMRSYAVDDGRDFDMCVHYCHRLLRVHSGIAVAHFARFLCS